MRRHWRRDGASALFIDRIADSVLAQILRTLPADSALIYTNPAEGFALWFDLTLVAGVVLAAPFAPLTSLGTITGAL